METIFALLGHAVNVIDIVGAVILIAGFAESFVFMIVARVRGSEPFLEQMTKVRCRLGTYLLLGLEFLIVSDIITTILEPTQEELMEVALLVAIRTAIGYFLGKELAEVREANE